MFSKLKWQFSVIILLDLDNKKLNTAVSRYYPEADLGLLQHPSWSFL